MDKLVFKQAQQIWTEIAQHKKPGELKLEVELYKKLLNIFQVGEYYYMVFNPPEMKIEFASEQITRIIGYTPTEFILQLLIEIIHPDDLQTFLDFEATVTEFWKNLPPEKVMKYKSRYDYRIRKKDGNYIRILQQIVAIQSDDDGAVLRTFVVHTDISHLKTNNRMVLSFIGLDGEPSYIDVQPVQKLVAHKNILTKREREVFRLLVEDYQTAQIAHQLNISTHTVSTHRKNIFKKTQTNSVVQLLRFGLEKGWV
jgi:DNA-binding CsgD family transcriptional regulator